jgi:hypothetical protein
VNEHVYLESLTGLICQLYTLEPETYSVPQDPTTRGRRFADEAESILQRENGQPSVPMFQGLFAMFCYEGNLGEGTKSIKYFSQAMDIYKELNHTEILQAPTGATDKARLQSERHALSWSMWGLYVTEW